MLAHSLRDSVHRGSEGMVQSLGQLVPWCLQPGSRQVDADAQLASSFCFGSGTRAMNYCHPCSVWVFLLSQAALQTPSKMTPNLIELTMKDNHYKLQPFLSHGQ